MRPLHLARAGAVAMSVLGVAATAIAVVSPIVLSIVAAILAVVATIALGIIGVGALGLGWIFNWIARGSQRAIDVIWTPRRIT